MSGLAGRRGQSRDVGQTCLLARCRRPRLRASPSPTKVPAKKRFGLCHSAGLALTGEHGEVDQQPVLGEHDGIGRHPVAALEEQDVIDHDVLGLDHLPAPVPPDRDAGREHLREPVGGPVGACLLDRGEDRVQQDHSDDRHAEFRKVREESEHRGRPEQQGEEVRQLAEQASGR